MWLIITIISYFLNAVSLLINKFLINKKITNPAVYAIFICLLMVFSLLLLPFDWRLPDFWQLILEVGSGFLFGAGVYWMFVSLKFGEASRVMPIIGGVQPLIVLPLAWWWLGEDMSYRFLLALALIVVGGFIISYGGGRAEKKAYGYAIISGIVFAISIVMLKEAFNLHQGFIAPFAISRLGSVFLGLLLLISPNNWRDVWHEIKTPQKESGSLFLWGQGAGALSSILLNLAFAISVGMTAIINALQGLQYVFLLLAVVILAKKFPQILKEDVSSRVLIQKILATILIIFGLVLIAF